MARNKALLLTGVLIFFGVAQQQARFSVKETLQKTREKVATGARRAARAVGLDQVRLEELGQAVGEGLEMIGAGAKKAVEIVKKPAHKTYHAISDPLARRIVEPFVQFERSPHYGKDAVVRLGPDVPEGEKAYLEMRDRITQKALEQFLGVPLGPTNIRIAVSASGGGFRAMQLSMGSLIGMERIGLFDALTYYVGVSGSTWLAPWFVRDISLQAYKKSLLMKLDKEAPYTFIRSNEEAGMILKELFVRHAYRQPWTGVDVYGAGLANLLLNEFGDQRHQVRLSTVWSKIMDGSRPFPILTAVGAGTGYGSHWFEFTPLEVGSVWLSAYVPTWAFGSKFSNGRLVEAAPEYSLGFFMGTCGSAFGVNNRELYSLAQKSFSVMGGALDRAIQGMLTVGVIGEGHVASAIVRTVSEVRNFTRGMPLSPLGDKRTLQLRDAGLNYNFDIVNSLRAARGVNILFILDGSGGVIAGELRKAERDARAKGIPFPPIDYTDIEKRSVSVFKDVNNPNAPLVIYCARIVDKQLLEQARNNPAFSDYVELLQDFDIEACIKQESCNTFNFKYTDREARQLMALSEFNMLMNADRLRQEITTWVYERYPQLRPTEQE